MRSEAEADRGHPVFEAAGSVFTHQKKRWIHQAGQDVIRAKSRYKPLMTE